MLASVSEPVRHLERWSVEVKWDGWRAMVYIDERGLRVRNRSGRQVSDSLPELAGLVDAEGKSAILDGEFVAAPDGVRGLLLPLDPDAPHRADGTVGRLGSYLSRSSPSISCTSMATT
jgi:bifunctional non-homologous end joining protein LigD